MELFCLHTVLMSNSCIWPIDKTLSGVITPGQSGSGSDGNEEVLPTHQICMFGALSSIV